MFPPRPSQSFTCFSALPTEVRLMIWKWASLHPRIVHLSKKRLKADDDPNWWRRVRSDKAIEGGEDGDDDESDYGSVDEDAIDMSGIEVQIAKKRLLTPDATYRGNVSRAQARNILRKSHWENPRSPMVGRDYPRSLHGFKSESKIPGVLLACRESLEVASVFYTRSFGALGALPEVWFNFSQDTVYLDTLGSTMGHSSLHSILKAHFSQDEVARIERLAFRRRSQFHVAHWLDEYLRDDDYYPHLAHLRSLHELCPELRELTVVDGHYAHQDRTMTRWERSGEQYVDLKYMKSTLDSDFAWRVDGFKISAKLLHSGIHPERALFKQQERIRNTEARLRRSGSAGDSSDEGSSDGDSSDGNSSDGDDSRYDSLDEESSDEVSLGEDYHDQDSHDEHSVEDRLEQEAYQRLPKVNIEVIVSSADEEQLLRDAYLFQKEHNEGCWYINPSDPTDCDYYAGDDIDEELDGLL